MGGMSLTLSTASNAEVRRAIWDHASTRMRALGRRRATRDVVAYYVSFQASDWGDPHHLTFSFSDAAGLCDGEMRAALHWLEVILIAEWPAIAAIASPHGITLTEPSRSRPDPIFFISGGKLGYAHHDPSPKEDHELWFFPADGGAKRVPLGRAPRDDRERLRRLIADGTCACEICQGLRAIRGEPLAPEQEKKPRSPRKPPKAPAPASAPNADLTTASTRYGWKLAELMAEPMNVVALDCGGGRKSPPLVRALPSFPLRALGLRGYTTRAVLPEISQLGHLEVLSLHATDLKQPIGDALSSLTSLRALDLDGISRKEVYEGSFWDLPKLEIVEVGNWDSYDRIERVRRLRHLITADNIDTKRFADRPIESLRWFRPVDAGVLRGWPLRFVEVGAGLSLPPREDVRFVDLGHAPGPLPTWLRDLPNLTGLSARSATGLPEWLADMPKLQVLQLSISKALAEAPEAFKVIERLESLRVLILAPDGGPRVPFDLSRLRKLEHLSVSWAKVKTLEDFLTGFDHVKKLYFSTEWSPSTERAFLEAHPFAERDGNVLRSWPFVTLYRWLLGPSDPSHWLARFSVSTPWPIPPKLDP